MLVTNVIVLHRTCCTLAFKLFY